MGIQICGIAIQICIVSHCCSGADFASTLFMLDASRMFLYKVGYITNPQLILFLEDFVITEIYEPRKGSIYNTINATMPSSVQQMLITNTES